MVARGEKSSQFSVISFAFRRSRREMMTWKDGKEGYQRSDISDQEAKRGLHKDRRENQEKKKDGGARS